MTVLHHFRPLAASAALLGAALITSPLEAQPQRRPPRADTPFLTVQVFRSADKIAGPVASDALRERLIAVYPGPVLWVIEKDRLVELLEQSGYPTNEQLARTDEASLARFLRADEYIRGSVVREDDGQYRIDAQLVLTRDLSLTQPLPPVRHERADRAAWQLVRPVQDARRQIENEQRCRRFASDGDYDRALAEANEAIERYPQATLVRYCKMNVLVAREASADEQLALANEILEIDPNSRGALAVAADAYQAKGEVDRANELLVRLLAANPTDAALANRVVEALAASGQYDVAKEIVAQAVRDNPGDLDLIRLRFLILTNAGDYRDAIQVGEEMIRLDTALADASFYTRLTALYASDSQPVMAANAASRGTTKFPQNEQLWQLAAQSYRNAANQIRNRTAMTDSAGATQYNDSLLQPAARDSMETYYAQSLAASKQALEINPYIPSGWVQVAQAYNERGQRDSVMAALRRATEVGDNADFIAQIASAVGNQLRVAGAGAQNLDTLRKAVSVLQFADSVTTLNEEVGPPDARRQRTPASPETMGRVKFILGATATTLFQTAATEAAATRNCELAREADQALITAQIALPGGAAFNQQGVVQLMQTMPELQAYVTQLIGQVCK